MVRNLVGTALVATTLSVGLAAALVAGPFEDAAAEAYSGTQAHGLSLA